MGSSICEYCMDNNIQIKKFKRMGLEDIYSSVVGSQNYLRNFYNIGEEALIQNIKLMLEV